MTFSTDTRTLREGDTYVAIRGDRYDGHDFVHEAILKGARGAIVERALAHVSQDRITLVQDSIAYLAQIARNKIKSANAQVIAITGSVGKTTTRNAVTQVMQTSGPVTSSVGNLNTLLGLSLTVANTDLQPNTRLVLEMGARNKGDLKEICEYFRPDLSIVTNVRGVHLETLGSIEGVQEEKSELVRALGTTGVACLNADDEYTRAMAVECGGQTLMYGTVANADVTPRDIQAKISLLGEHVIYIMLAAFSAGIAVGIDPRMINEALSGLKPEKGRLNRLPARGGALLIDDSYNASPDAMHIALNVLRQQTAKRRIAFLGDMLELGDSEQKAHGAILRKASTIADHVYCCGSRMEIGAEELSSELRRNVCGFYSSEELASELIHGRIYLPEHGDVILVKGSQGARMERISKALLSEQVSPESVLPRQNEAWLSIE